MTTPRTTITYRINKTSLNGRPAIDYDVRLVIDTSEPDDGLVQELLDHVIQIDQCIVVNGTTANKLLAKVPVKLNGNLEEGIRVAYRDFNRELVDNKLIITYNVALSLTDRKLSYHFQMDIIRRIVRGEIFLGIVSNALNFTVGELTVPLVLNVKHLEFVEIPHIRIANETSFGFNWN